MLNNLLLLAQLGAKPLGGRAEPVLNQPAAPAPAVPEPIAQVAEVAQTAAAAAPADLTTLFLYFTVFMLAVFVGFEIITKVPPTLHTPLMSGSNAISGITLIGAMVMAGSDQGSFASLLALLAIIFATMNVVGGFLVTHRMLEMFQKKK